jgi:hypothetical protein
MADEQQLLVKFYDIDNLVSIDIEMPEAVWADFAAAAPKFGWRNELTPELVKETNGHRYEWSPTTSVTLSGTNYPPKQKWTGVGIVKKSFGGSRREDRPSFKLEFGHKFKNMKKADKDAAAATEAAVAKLLGTSRLTLNNSIQDNSFIRQPVGYEIFRKGGIPAAWCNLAKVTVTDPAQNNKVLLKEVYVNLEPTREPYLRRNFKNDQGNMYETEAWFDLTPDNFKSRKYDSSGFSPFENQEDLRIAIDQIGQGFEAAKKVFDMDQITKVLAMSAVIQDRDGYANNTFFYNDVIAVEAPKVGNGIKFKMIPSGIDAILLDEGENKFSVKIWTPGKNGGRSSRIAELMTKDPGGKANLKKACDAAAATFTANLNGYLTYVDRAKVVLKKAGLDPDASPLKGEIDKVVRVLKSVPSGMKTVSIA